MFGAEARASVQIQLDGLDSKPPIFQADSETKLDGEIKRVPLESLNTIAQARNLYTNIDELAGAIQSSRTLIHTPFVAQLDEEGAKSYLSFVYGIYGDRAPDHKKVDDLIPYETGIGTDYLIVVSGHRRLKALEMLGEKFVDVKVKQGMAPLDALYLQAQENTHKSLTDDERAEQHGRLWVVSKTKDRGLTLEKFAKMVGVSQLTLRKDLRFYNLPEEVKTFATSVENPKKKGDLRTYLPFNVVCQLGRLTEAGAPVHDVLFLARRFFEQNVTSERVARERVSAYLRDYNSSAETVLDIFGENAARLSKQRRTTEVARRFVTPIDEAISFLSRVNIAIDNGLADQSEDNLSFAGAASRIIALSNVFEPLLPRLEGLAMDEEEIKRILAVFNAAKTYADHLEICTNPELDTASGFNI